MAGLILVAVGLVPTVAVAGDPGAAELTIRAQGGGFSGKLTSENAGRICEENRPVSVFKVKPGQDKRIGSDRTARNGDWSTGNISENRGRFYAIVKPTDPMMRQCEGDKSNVINVD